MIELIAKFNLNPANRKEVAAGLDRTENFPRPLAAEDQRAAVAAPMDWTEERQKTCALVAAGPSVRRVFGLRVKKLRTKTRKQK